MHNPFSPTPLPSYQERRAYGKSMRDALPREQQANLSLDPEKRLDILTFLNAGVEGCIPHLIPLRFGRMITSPFAFFRGTAGLMAADLNQTTSTGEYVQATGDAHCANFGAFATAERNLVFDLNDFDETLRAPWEWDLKRLATSTVLAAREAGHSEQDAHFAAASAARAYRLHMRTYAKQHHLDVWYERIDASKALADMAADARAEGHKMFKRARQRTHLHSLNKLAHQTDDGWRLRNDPPLLFHTNDPEIESWIDEIRDSYLETVPPDRRTLLSRYHLADWAVKATGVGSCGRRVLVLLLTADDDDVIFLQAKEALHSALEPYLGRNLRRNPAKRIVQGQQLMQAALDPFLGWAQRGEHHFYVRQLRDQKGRFDLASISPRTLEEVIELCGWALARAHARTGDAATLAGYMGKNNSFEQAIASFAVKYADQAEQDYAVMQNLVQSGEIEVMDDPKENR